MLYADLPQSLGLNDTWNTNYFLNPTVMGRPDVNWDKEPTTTRCISPVLSLAPLICACKRNDGTSGQHPASLNQAKRRRLQLR